MPVGGRMHAVGGGRVSCGEQLHSGLATGSKWSVVGEGVSQEKSRCVSAPPSGEGSYKLWTCTEPAGLTQRHVAGRLQREAGAIYKTP